jgi:hypothetical protein
VSSVTRLERPLTSRGHLVVPARTALIAVNFLGRLSGTTTFEPVVERIGFKYLILFTAALQIIAVIGECGEVS